VIPRIWIRRYNIGTFINSLFYNDKLIIYYNIKDAKQAFSIRIIEDLNEIENLLPLTDLAIHKKTGARTMCSNAGKYGGA